MAFYEVIKVINLRWRRGRVEGEYGSRQKKDLNKAQFEDSKKDGKQNQQGRKRVELTRIHVDD